MIGVTDPVWGVIAAAVITAVPASIAAWNGIRNRKQLKTRNGHTPGDLLDAIKDDVTIIKMWMIEHQREHHGVHHEDERQ